MTNFNGEILTYTTLFTVGTQDGYGVLNSLVLTNINVDGYGRATSSPLQKSGTQDGYGQHRLTALASADINPIPRYKLSCEDNTGLRHYWVDNSISLTRAPPGFTYISATLVNEGKF